MYIYVHSGACAPGAPNVGSLATISAAMYRHVLTLIVILLAFAAAFFKAAGHQVATGFGVRQALVAGSGQPYFTSRYASSKLNTQTHAASAIELKDGRIRAFWFSGSREGAKDVEIHSAVFDPVAGLWGAEQAVATREGSEQALQRYISKLGNPVPARAADGRLWLYYVTVSLGGWAGSSITAIHSEDEGATWSAAQRLVTSPFINISTLVKGAPFLYGDGTLGLPVYHEFISKFGEILHLDKDGAVLDKQRLTAGGNGAIQPVVLVKNADEGLVLMRNASGDKPRHVLSISTTDGGEHWTTPAKTSLLNPDAALTATVLPDGRLLSVLNNQESGRDTLSLMVLKDGGANWNAVYQLEDQHAAATDAAHYPATEGGAYAGDYAESARRATCAGQDCRYEFSYPYLIQAKNGDFHLLYTWNRALIKHISFNQAWLEQQIGKAP
jgi:predicted neuraminidase